jgi:regulator of chromosome condensation
VLLLVRKISGETFRRFRAPDLPRYFYFIIDPRVYLFFFLALDFFLPPSSSIAFPLILTPYSPFLSFDYFLHFHRSNPPAHTMPPKRAAAAKAAATKTAATAKPAPKTRGRPAATKAAAPAPAPSKPAKGTVTTATKKKPQPKKPLQEAKANTSAKRKADADLEEKPQTKKQRKQVTETTAAAPTKRVIKKPTTRAPKPAAAAKPPKKKVVINTAPTTRLDVFAFGSNSFAELGMGDTFKKAECPRAKFNTVLSEAGVVQISAGGMHGIALTHDSKVLTWGVNDQGALGRDTNWEGGLVDMDKAEESDSDDDEEIEVNPKEATPTVIDLSGVGAGTVFTQVVAADSASFALTDDGLVYGWGTFRVCSP